MPILNASGFHAKHYSADEFSKNVVANYFLQRCRQRGLDEGWGEEPIKTSRHRIESERLQLPTGEHQWGHDTAEVWTCKAVVGERVAVVRTGSVVSVYTLARQIT